MSQIKINGKENRFKGIGNMYIKLVRIGQFILTYDSADKRNPRRGMLIMYRIFDSFLCHTRIRVLVVHCISINLELMK